MCRCSLTPHQPALGEKAGIIKRDGETGGSGQSYTDGRTIHLAPRPHEANLLCSPAIKEAPIPSSMGFSTTQGPHVSLPLLPRRDIAAGIRVGSRDLNRRGAPPTQASPAKPTTRRPPLGPRPGTSGGVWLALALRSPPGPCFPGRGIESLAALAS